MSDPTKRCPMCGEEILAVAIKCKHCGEMVNAPAEAATSAAKPGGREAEKGPRSGILRAMGKQRGMLAVVGIAVLLGGIAFALRDSDLVASLHSDVQWHREWQDRHTDKERTRVTDLYASLYQKHPDDPDYAYLAARALPSGKEQADAFTKAAEKFPASPWTIWGLASVEDDADAANELRLKALSMSKDEPPVPMVAYTIDYLAQASEWEKLADLNKKYSNLINSEGKAACAMTFAEFRRGNHQGALAWERKAESLGCNEHKDLRGTIDGMKAIGMASDVLSSRLSTTEGGSFELGGVEVSETSGGSKLRLDLRYHHGRPDSTIFPDKCFVKTSRGTRIFATTSGYVDVRANEKKGIRLHFTIPSGETVDDINVDTGLLFGNSARLIGKVPGASMIVVMALRPIGDAPIVGIAPE